MLVEQHSECQLEMTMPSGGTVPHAKKVGLMGLQVCCTRKAGAAFGRATVTHRAEQYTQ